MTTFAQDLIARLATARHVAVLTGAGASAESGIPTFRDPGGLWSTFDPTELATLEAFKRNPVRVQSWYSARIKAARSVEPNPCHVALAALESLVPNVSIITQNVDGLHQRAGSSNVFEVHGNLLNIFCASCGRKSATLDVAAAAAHPAVCKCGGLLRPGVIWYGEVLPEQVLRASMEIACTADVFFSVGTSAEVFPAAGLPTLASDSGAYLVEINVERTVLSPLCDEVVIGPAGTLMPLLLNQLRRAVGMGIVAT